jgi:hypothetical protein
VGVDAALGNLEPDNSDPLRRRSIHPMSPKDPRLGPSPDLVAIVQQVLVRLEKLEEEMRVVKTKLKLP